MLSLCLCGVVSHPFIENSCVCVMFMCRPSVCVVSRYVDTLYADYLLAFVLCRCCIDTL